jgi:hypothetical protein
MDQVERAPASALLALLRENWALAPAHFAFNKDGLYLHRSLENRGLTPVRLRKEIDEFDALVRRTSPIWSKKNFAPPGASSGNGSAG